MKTEIFAFEEVLKKAIIEKERVDEKTAQLIFENILKDIKEWIKKDFNPELIPTCLYDYGTENIPVFDICRLANETILTESNKVINEDKNVQLFIELLSKCQVKYDFFIAQGNKHYLNLTHFAYDNKLFPKMEGIFKEIKKDQKSLFTILLAIKRNFPEVWYGCKLEWLRFSYHTSIFNRYDGKNLKWLENSADPVLYMEETFDLVNSISENFERIMGVKFEVEEEPNRDSTGHYDCYYICRVTSGFMARTFVDNAKPFCFSLSESNLFGESNHLRDIIELPNWSESKVTFARGRKGEIIKISSYLKWLDWMAFYISRGKETTKRTTENFEKSIELVIESYTTHEEARLKKNLLEQFKDYPSAAGLINKLSLHKLKNLDYNPDFGMIAYLDGRSEWGSSGGTALYSQVRLWVRGNEYSKEFQYRDRYSGTNDNYAYEFRSVKILKVEKEKENLHVLIEAIPGQEKFHSTKVEFNVELSTKAESLPEATPDQQREFLSFFEKIKAEKMAGLTKFNGQYFRKPVFNGDTSSGYSPYPQPTISCSELKPNLLTGAFVIKETIDHRVDDLQKRYTLYLVVGETCLEVYEDHAYEIGEGDASIFGLKISEDKIFFSTRGGRKERPLR